jgi:UDP-3-O-[3-hydroxymyristoyl] glucosamine N-acyltransferase
MRVDRRPPFSLGEIADALGGQLAGNRATPIHRVRAIEAAGADEIAVIMDPKYLARIDTLPAAALVVPADAPQTRDGVIVVADAKRAFIALLQMFEAPPERAGGIHPRAIVAEDVRMGEHVSVGPGAVIERGVTLSDGVAIGANCSVGANVVLGAGTRLHPNVTIYAGTVVGQRVVIHAGTVIGSDGFGYFEGASGNREKIPQIGIVEIGDDVEIGANCAIDRATLEKTTIARGTKIDNLVQIGHNSRIGEHVCIVGQAGVAGSVTIGNYALLSGQVGVSDHVKVGERVILAAKAGVHSDIPSGAWLGSPAMPLERAGRVFAAQRQLPEYRERVRALEDLLAAIEKRLLTVERLGVAAPAGAVHGNGNGSGNGSGYHTEPADET